MNRLELENVYGKELVQQEVAAQLMQDILAQYSDTQEWNVTVVLQDDAFITDMHGKYLDDATPTDVITFNLSEEDLSPCEGEIYISVDRAIENSKAFGVSEKSEVYRLIVHGLLHLMGLNDKTEEEQTVMRSKEEKFLKKFDLL